MIIWVQVGSWNSSRREYIMDICPRVDDLCSFLDVFVVLKVFQLTVDFLWFLGIQYTHCIPVAHSWMHIPAVPCWSNSPSLEDKGSSEWKSWCNSCCVLCRYLGISNRRSLGAGRQCKQRFKGEAYYTQALAACNSGWWRTRHPDQGYNSRWWRDPSHSQISHQQVHQGLVPLWVHAFVNSSWKNGTPLYISRFILFIDNVLCGLTDCSIWNNQRMYFFHSFLL